MTYSKRYQIAAVLVLLVIYTSSLLDRYIVNILAESIKVELGLEDWQIGLMTGLAFALCYSLLGVPIARYADRGDRPLIISLAVAIWSLATVVTGAVQNFWQILLARTVVGIGEAGCTPPAHSLISEYVPKENRAFALSIYSLAVPLGIILGMAVGGVVGDKLGWRWAFVIVGAPGLLIAIFSYYFLREPRRQLLANKAAANSEHSIIEALKLLWKVPTFKWVFIATCLTGIGQAGVLAFQASFFLRIHNDALNDFALSIDMGPMSVLGLMLGLATGTTALFGSVFGGYLADKWRQRGDGSGLLMVPSLSMILVCLTTMGVYLSPSLSLAIISQTLCGLFATMYLGPSFSAAHSVLPSSMRATASAVLLLAVSLVGLSLGPLFVGILSDVFARGFGLGSGESLRWAILIVSVSFALAAPTFWYASRHFKHDVLE